MFSFRQTQQNNFEMALAQMDLYARSMTDLKDKEVPLANDKLSKLTSPGVFLSQDISTFDSHPSEYEALLSA